MNGQKVKASVVGKCVTSRFMKLLVILILIIFFLHFCGYSAKEKEGVFEMWWVWRLGDEDKIKTIKPIEWGETADNSKIMGLIEFKRKADAPQVGTVPEMLTVKPEKESYSENHTVNHFKTGTKSAQDKLIVILQKNDGNTAITNQTFCDTCTWSVRLEDVEIANAVVIEDDYVRSNKIPTRR